MRLFDRRSELLKSLSNLGKLYGIHHGTNLLDTIEKLQKNESIEDETITSHFKAFSKGLQSNCDSVAQGLFLIAGTLCYFRPHLAADLMSEPIRSLYYLGIETMEEIKKYVNWLVDFEKPYLGRSTHEVHVWLREFANTGDEAILEASKMMISTEDIEWRKEDPDYTDIPEIMRSQPVR